MMVSGAVETVVVATWLLSVCSVSPHKGLKQNEQSEHEVTVPSTVFGSLHNDSVFVSDRLIRVNTSVYDEPWCYQANVSLPPRDEARLILDLRGINYKADLLVNDHLLRSHHELVGTFRRFLVDVTDAVDKDAESAHLLLRVYRPHDQSLPPSNHDTDLAISFVDWAPRPPDRNMGLFQPVYLHATPFGLLVDSIGAAVTHIHPSNLPNEEDATACVSLSLSATLHNALPIPQTLNATVSIGGLLDVWQIVTLEHNTSATVGFNASTNRELAHVCGVRLWWPWRYGKQHTASIAVVLRDPKGHAVLARASRRIGLRNVTSQLDANGYRLFFVNNRKFMVYGGGYSPHLFLRYNDSYQRGMLEDAKRMGLNTVRLEGKMMTAAFFAAADELGIMVLPGWCCCDAWQHWQYWNESQRFIAAESLRTQMQRLRQHASVLAFLYGSDEAPPPDIEQLYLRVRNQEHWHLPFISAASNVSTPAGGRTGVKMSGPYAWVPPTYWYQGMTHPTSGAAFGFSTEISPGAAPVRLASARKMFEPTEMWPINKAWDFHCGSQLGLFRDLRFFLPPFNARFGKADSAEEFLFKSQLMAFEGQRAMFDAYAVFKYSNSTGVVQWMLNNPFPSLIWHLVDFYGDVGGGYFGTRSALSPSTHAAFDASTGRIHVIQNDVTAASPALQLHIDIWSTASQLLHAMKVHVGTVAADSAVMDVADVTASLNTFCSKDPSTTLLVRLRLINAATQAVEDDATYFNACTPDVLDWSNSTFYITYCKQLADYTALCDIAAADIDVTPTSDASAVRVHNTANTIAFFLELSVVHKDDESVALGNYRFSDNYITLYPNATREISLNSPLEEHTMVAATDWRQHCKGA